MAWNAGMMQSIIPRRLLLLCILMAETVALRPALSKLPPHSGYHGGNADPKKPFFEGWYMRVVTETQGSIAFIAHVFDPRSTGLSSQRQGVGMQVITPSGSIQLETPDVSTFRADSHEFAIRNYFTESNDFYRLTASRASGRISSGKSDKVKSVEFDFDIAAQIGWGGGNGARQYSTAGWLAASPAFEPHYQVMISKGTSMGSVKVQTETGEDNYNLDGASVYLEKNWGGSFPFKWWWIQANTFSSDLTVTSTAARRSVPLLKAEEELGLIGLHWNGDFLPFPNVEWKVKWGMWQIAGQYNNYAVQLTGTCDSGGGFPVDCPTPTGMKPSARETFAGRLRVQLFHKGEMILDDSTDKACLEIGGLPWLCSMWLGKSEMKEPIKTIAMNVELERQVSDILQVASAFVEIPGL